MQTYRYGSKHNDVSDYLLQYLTSGPGTNTDTVSTTPGSTPARDGESYAKVGVLCFGVCLPVPLLTGFANEIKALWVSLGSMMQGWDYVVGGQLASLPEFKRQFGVQLDDGSYIVPAKYLSAWASIGLATDLVTAIVIAPMLEKWGRKPLISAACIISTVGVILQQLATEWRVHLAGRAVNGVHAESPGAGIAMLTFTQVSP